MHETNLLGQEFRKVRNSCRNDVITLKKWDQLRDKMLRLKIIEDDLQEKFILGSGRGGQKLQKTSSCVYLKHLPTGIQIKCQRSRSQQNNRYFARIGLCEKIAFLFYQEKSKTQQRIEKIKRQKRKRSKRAKEKQKLIEALAVGDEVLTTGGIIGRLTKLRDNFVVITVGKDVDMTFQKSAIATVLPKGTMESMG